jgi:photosystem II stability/assembly factor-like uncharacterized protein
LHELVAKNPLSTSSKQTAWQHGTLTLDATGSGALTDLILNSQSQSDMNGISLLISSNGVISMNASSDMHGFMSSDKSTIMITSTENGGGYGLLVLQKKVSGTTYSKADLQGIWQMHGLSAGNSSGDHAGWAHATLTGDASGNFTGSFVGVGGGGSLSTTASISSSGIITGMSSIGSNIHGFMSANKKTFYMTMTGNENSDYNLVTFQKQVSGTTYSISDMQGLWQSHSLVSDNTNDTDQWASWSHSQSIIDSQGNVTITNLIVNGQSRNDLSTNMSITSDGIVSFTDVSNTHGFLSADKSLSIMTTPDMGSGGYTLGILQKDLSVSSDIGLQVQFEDNNNGWVTIYNIIYGGAKLYKTTDGGNTWTAINNSVGGIYQFIDASNGWMVGNNIRDIGEGNLNNIYHTTDGGLTWMVQASNIGTANSIYFTDLTHGWVVGKNGLIMKTTDGGNNWTTVTNPLSSTAKSKCVFFLDSSTGWIGSHMDGDNTQYVLGTKDGGTTWTKYVTPVGSNIFSISFADTNSGWLTSDYGQIAKYSYNPTKYSYNQITPRLWYVIGSAVGDGSWDYSTSGLGKTLYPMSLVNGNVYNETGDGVFTYTGYFLATKWFKLVRNIGSWDIQWGNSGSEGINSPVMNNGTSSNFVVPTDGYYTITLNSIDNTLTIEASGSSSVSYSTIGLMGDFNSWGSDIAMIPVKSANNNFWYTTYEFTHDYLADQGVKFRVNGSWNINWGNTYFPYGIGLSAGANIPYTAGKYIILFNDLDGCYYFILKQTTTGTDVLNNDAKVTVYPNPATDAIRIAGFEGKAMITISDLEGRIVLTKEIKTDESVSLSSLSNGVYLATIKSNKSNKTEKLIIHR